MFCSGQTQGFGVTLSGKDLAVSACEHHGYEFTRVRVVLCIEDARRQGFHRFFLGVRGETQFARWPLKAYSSRHSYEILAHRRF